jgi:hypothetical protein
LYAIGYSQGWKSCQPFFSLFFPLPTNGGSGGF